GRLDHVAHVDIVTGESPVAVDDRNLALQQRPSEDGDHSGLAVGVLAGAVDVARTDGHGGEPFQCLKEPQVVLHGQLGGAVGGHWGRGLRLGGGDHVGLAVDGAAGGEEYEAPHLRPAAGLDQAQTAHDVDVGVEDGVL